MHYPLSCLPITLLAAATVFFTPLTSARFLESRALGKGDFAFENKWIDHDKVIPFQQMTSDGLEGDIELQFKPWLVDNSGCWPYAAVDVNGNHGAGLDPTGKSRSECRDKGNQGGQLYTRVGVSNGRRAVLYSWYIPKIQTNTESHHHWYLSIVVWLHRPNPSTTCPTSAAEYEVAGVSYSTAQITYDLISSPNTILTEGDAGPAGGTRHPVVGYDGQVNVYASTVGPEYALSPPMVSWSKLSEAARVQFNLVFYENARCPFSDENFQASLDAAYSPAFYEGKPPETDPGCVEGTAVEEPPTPTVTPEPEPEVTPTPQPEVTPEPEPTPTKRPPVTPTTALPKPRPTKPAEEPNTDPVEDGSTDPKSYEPEPTATPKPTAATKPTTTEPNVDPVEDGEDLKSTVPLPVEPTYTPAARH